MTRERNSQAELGPLLRALGREERLTPERGAEEEDERAARFAARIDQQLEGLAASRSPTRRTLWIPLAVAAAIPLAWLGARAVRAPRSDLSIGREPASRARGDLARQTPASEVPKAAAPELMPPATPPVRSAPRSSAAPQLSASAASSAEVSAESTLGQENRLFGEAAAAARAGDVEGALADFERLLHDYPQSPLSQTALVRKFRLLTKAGRKTEAAVEARRYLSSYPTGFAQVEAQAVSRGEASSSASSGDEPSPR